MGSTFYTCIDYSDYIVYGLCIELFLVSVSHQKAIESNIASSVVLYVMIDDLFKDQ